MMILLLLLIVVTVLLALMLVVLLLSIVPPIRSFVQVDGLGTRLPIMPLHVREKVGRVDLLLQNEFEVYFSF